MFCCIFPVPQIFWGKYKDTWSRSRATNTDRLLPKHTPSVSLSAFPHFLFSCHSLCCHLHLPIRHTHSAFLWFPLFPSSFTSLSQPLYYHQRPIWPTLYELQLKMMSLIIWVEIMWLSFPLCVSPGPCVHAHISLCALHCVCVLLLCIDVHIIIFRQKWETSLWAGCCLNCCPTVVFTDEEQTLNLSCFRNDRNRVLVMVSWGPDSYLHVKEKYKKDERKRNEDWKDRKKM